jgi:hypothetical protein
LGPFECRGGVVRDVDSIALRELIDSGLENGREFFSLSALFDGSAVPPAKLTAFLGHSWVSRIEIPRLQFVKAIRPAGGPSQGQKIVA